VVEDDDALVLVQTDYADTRRLARAYLREVETLTHADRGACGDETLGRTNAAVDVDTIRRFTEGERCNGTTESADHVGVGSEVANGQAVGGSTHGTLRRGRRQREELQRGQNAF
jgi:hypothetical protein